MSKQLNKAFTLAEILITLGVIGVVAAVTMPVLMTNINERVLKEQVRTAKYKLTLATDKMKSLGLLNNQYLTTKDFVDVLQKHLKLAKVCDENHLSDCWPTYEIDVPGGNPINVSTIKTGRDIKALGLGIGNTKTVSLITADGISMIMTYSPNCTPLDPVKTYSWSTVDNKPETNATTNCISAIMDVNGSKKPNRLGKDVRTLNSLFGSQEFDAATYKALSYNDCQKYKDKLGINKCFEDPEGTPKDNDYWGGALKYCQALGLNLPSAQTLAVLAGIKYGRSDITPHTIISTEQYTRTNQNNKSCNEFWSTWTGGFAGDGSYSTDNIICINNGKSDIGDDTDAPINLNGHYWSSSEYSARYAVSREFDSGYNTWYAGRRLRQAKALCVAD